MWFFMPRIDTSYNKRYYTWTTSTGMNDYYSKVGGYIIDISLMYTLLEQPSGWNNWYSGHKQHWNSDDHRELLQRDKLLCQGGSVFGRMCEDDLSVQGHLSPDAGFIYNVEQDATYYFLNVAPQFQSFNNGNWKSLEINTRDLAMK